LEENKIQRRIQYGEENEKNMIHFITYSNDLYGEARDYCTTMAIKKGKVDTATAYKPEDIDKDFWEANKELLEVRAGNGLWLWKPYIVNMKLQDVEEGEIVLYCDAGSYFFRNCRTIIDSMDDDIWISNIPLIEKQFTKPELLKVMGCTEGFYTDTNQVQANFIAIRKTERGMKFAKEWLDWCTSKDALTRESVYLENPPEYQFFGHRSDQSVLSLLSKKWELNIHQDPSQYGRIPEKYYAKGRIYKQPDNSGEYNPCIILHRGKRPEMKACMNQWMCTWLPLPWVHAISEPCRIVAKDGEDQSTNGRHQRKYR
jgi:hypothetical protein